VWLVAQPMVGAAHPDLFTLAFHESERATTARRDDSYSSISAVSAVLTDTLASMTKHSCRAFADVVLSRGTCS
jgi:hypothetical protein